MEYLCPKEQMVQKIGLFKCQKNIYDMLGKKIELSVKKRKH